MAVSNNIIAAVNFIALMCSIPILTAGIWLSSKQDNQCIHWLRFPVIFIGILFLLVALSGFVGSYWNKPGLLSFFLFSMAFLIVCLLILLILAFTVARPSGQFSVPGRRYKEYRLAGFSKWLRDHVTDDENWHGIRACLANSKVCPKLSQEYDSAYQFFNAHLAPIESGCCKPPTLCGYQYVNPTMWINSVNSVADADCSIWNNDPSQLCYSCDSCKAGLLGNLRNEWRKANVILIVVVVVLICVYLIACNAFKNAQITNLSQQHK